MGLELVFLVVLVNRNGVGIYNFSEPAARFLDGPGLIVEIYANKAVAVFIGVVPAPAVHSCPWMIAKAV